MDKMVYIIHSLEQIVMRCFDINNFFFFYFSDFIGFVL